MINDAREVKDLPALTIDKTLTTVARWRSKDMAVRGYFSHLIPPLNKTVFDYFTRDGEAGENIAWTVSTDPRTIVKMFMQSPPHRAVLFDKRWKYIGVGMFHYHNKLYITMLATERKVN
jgi:uncharacterized protein YkwD